MPHLFANRPRFHDLVNPLPVPGAHFRWETVNAALYKLGGLTFIAGSILFYPGFADHTDLGAWIFLVGSLLYLVVTGHDLAETIHYRRHHTGETTIWHRLETVSSVSYVTGTLLFTVGSAFFLSSVDLTVAGAWCFIVGSLLFVLGATVNVLQIVIAEDLITLQLMNLTALAFVTGSVLFTVASVPYLWRFEAAGDGRLVDAYLASQYLAGSVLFWVGGLFNYWRAYVVFRCQTTGGTPRRPGAARSADGDLKGDAGQ